MLLLGNIEGGVVYFVKNLIKVNIGYNYAYQLWYIPMYMVIVLIYPIIIKYIKNDKKRLIIFIAIALIWILAETTIGGITRRYPYPLSFIYYFYLFELGAIFYRKKDSIRLNKSLIFVYCILIILCNFTPISINIMLTEAVITPIAVVIFFYFSKMIKESKALFILEKYSFYIFLFHQPFFVTKTLNILSKFGINKYFILIPITCAIAIVLSITLSIIISKIPVINNIFEINSSVLKIKTKTKFITQ